MTTYGRRMAVGLALAALTLFLAIQGADAAGPAQPHGLGAHALAQAPALPYLAWSAVPGADHYQVQVAADPAFKAPVFSAGLGDFTTANTRATLRKTLPSHRYWWRVRAASKAGSVSGWSTSSFALSWNRSVSRDRSGGPNVLRWRPITGAVSYLVELSFDDHFGSLVGGRGITTSATSVSLPVTLPKNTYYWRVTPIDAEGNRGARSPRTGGWQFKWAGPASTRGLTVSNAVTSGDLGGASTSSLFLPQLSWSPAAGAVRYEVEINPDANWANGSRVCCTGATIATSLTPTVSLRSNRYYWRVRGIDASGNAGAWFPAGNGTNAAAFTKTFGNVCSADLAENCIPQPAAEPDEPARRGCERHAHRRRRHDQQPDRALGSDARCVELRVRDRAVPGRRRLLVDRACNLALGRHDSLDGLDAARQSPCFASLSRFARDPVERIAQPRPRDSVLRARARPDGARSAQQPGLRRLHVPTGAGVPVRWVRRRRRLDARLPGSHRRASPSARCRSSPGTPCRAPQATG